MRIANRLLLGATVLVFASAPLLAQTGARPTLPAVPAQPGRQALVTPAPKPSAMSAAPTATPVSAAAPSTSTSADDPPTTDDLAAPTTSDAPPSASAELTPPVAAPAPAPVTSPAPTGKQAAVPPKPGAAQSASAAPAASAAPEAQAGDTAAAAPAEPEEPQGNPDDSNSIVATVNDQSISDYEVRQRVALYLATSGINQQLTPDQKKRIRGQILESLEAEKIQLQEAVKKKITVSPTEVDKRINSMMADNKFDINQLRETLIKAGASEDALRAQITASIAWMKTVQDEYGDRVNITPDMVDVEMARHAEGANKPHYRVLEIFLPVDNPEQDSKVKKDAEEIITQLRQGAPFAMVARQFSQHPTAATNGDMGWINDGQLAPELNDALRKLEVGAMTDPIRSTGGYYILALRERQEPMGTKIDNAPKGPTGPAGTLPLARLLFPVNPRAPKAELEGIMNVANQIVQRYQGCASLQEIHKQLTGTVYMDLGNVKLEELSPQIQKAMASTGPGEAAQPFMSEAGIELITRCDKRPEIKTAYVMPTRQQVEDQLFQNQISALARRYLRDLRRAANIQVRDETQPDALIR